MNQHPNFLFLAAMTGLMGVALGAFGAHGLSDILSKEMLAVYKTGVDYQMWHALGLALIALLLRQVAADKMLVWAAYSMLAGIVIFSGSLYVLALSGVRWLGAITPIGGLALITGWILFAISSYK